MTGVAGQNVNSKKGTEEIAVLFVGATISQVLGSLGHPAASGALQESLNALADIVTRWGGDIVKRSDDAILARFIEPGEALKAAIHMQRTTGGATDGKTSLALRVAIHYGQGTTDNGALRGDMAIFAAEAASLAKAGHIYLSPEARRAMPEVKSLEFRPIAIEGSVLFGRSSVSDVVWQPDTDCTPGHPLPAGKEGGAAAVSTSFLHGPALMEGENPPCFYCGSRRHRTTLCPSKQLSYGTCGLEALGRLTMGEINRLFSTYLAASGGDLPALPAPPERDDANPVFYAPWSFYELKRAFQLRFLGIIWSASPKDDWYKVKEAGRETSARGGLLWLARDCIRMSELNEAEDFLQRYARQNSKDYRPDCGLAFVHIEWGSYASAVDCLIEALGRETTPVQKTHLLLLLSRVYTLTGDDDKALAALKEALRIEPYCLEARFEEVVRYFQLKMTSEAASRLLKLIHLRREYYVAALISPELAEFQSSLAPEFRRLVMGARKEAQAAAGEADKAVAALKGLLGDDDEDVAEMVSFQGRMQGLLETPDALIASQDAVHTARKIVADCGAIEKQRKDRVVKMLLKLEERAGTLLRDRTATAKLTPLVRPILERLRSLAEGLERREPFDRCIAGCEALAGELGPVEMIARRLRERAEFLKGWASVLRDVAVVLLITVTTGLAFLPFCAFCVDALHPASSLADSLELRLAQKVVFLAGGLSSVIFALSHMVAGKAKPGKKR